MQRVFLCAHPASNCLPPDQTDPLDALRLFLSPDPRSPLDVHWPRESAVTYHDRPMAAIDICLNLPGMAFKIWSANLA